ncbi:MAG TPA: dihydrofolate reductase family protein [Polyangiaceae bacterium]|nr:dihydrofolate reductase family protein [Polyangiaceae bacterium]
MQRPRCSVFIATSLDGYIARKDGSFDFLSIVEQPNEDYGFAEFFATVDVLVIGRHTYETALGFPEWPYAGKRCIVLTHRETPSVHGEQFFAGAATGLVEQLGLGGAQRLYVDGGAVIRDFLAAGLIDDMTISIVPVLLGEGIALFGPEVPEQRLVLESSRSYPSGLVQLHYLRKPPS